MMLTSVGLDYYASNYRFSSVKGDSQSLQESYKTARGYSFASIQDLNSKLSNLESKGEKSSLLLNINEQPKDIMELFQKIGGGKYLTFLQNNVDGILVGRNLEESVSGSYMESLGLSLSGDSAEEMSDGKMSKVIAIDTFNITFQSVETETQADEVYTKQAQSISIFLNELKQAYFLSKGDTSESEEVYQFMKTAVEDIEKYLEEGNSLVFVPSAEQGIFKQALSMMKDTITSHISETYGSSSTIQWSA